MADNEQELLQLIRAGNPRGFQLLYAQYADRVMGFARRLSGSRSRNRAGMGRCTFLKRAKSLRPTKNSRQKNSFSPAGYRYRQQRPPQLLRRADFV